MRTPLRVVVAVAAASLALSATSAVAVIGGQRDGNDHPNVGMILGTGPDDHLLVCTGTLIDPQTVLTAAHCVQPHIEGYGDFTYEITFANRVDVVDDFPAPLLDGIPGTPDPNPAYDPALFLGGEFTPKEFRKGNEQDVGLLHLSAPVTGITPARIVDAKDVARFALRRRPDVLQVGYGDNTDDGTPTGNPFMDGYRNRSLFPIKDLRGGTVFGNARPLTRKGYFGTPSFGDSGSPFLMDGEVGAVFAWSDDTTNVAAGVRLDAGPGRAFLRSRGVIRTGRD